MFPASSIIPTNRIRIASVSTLFQHHLFNSKQSRAHSSIPRETAPSNPNTSQSPSTPQRVWRPYTPSTTWSSPVSSLPPDRLESLLSSISLQEFSGGRMSHRGSGVLRECATEDMRLLVDNYTAPALASALRDREQILQLAASLLQENKMDELREVLLPFEKEYVQLRRLRKDRLDLRSRGFANVTVLEMLRKSLTKLPKRVSQAHRLRAGVVLPLCNIRGVPCVLFEKRSKDMRAHPDEVCLPGGMVCNENDQSIVSTCLREMSEEVDGIKEEDVTVLGVLRCNWGEVVQLTGVAVTPVVCYVGELDGVDLNPNEDEVAECFTVPLKDFLKKELWIHKEDSAPIFTGGPYIIWGLTGYILNRFVKDVLATYDLDI